MSSRLREVAARNARIAEEGSYQLEDGRRVDVGETLAAARSGTVSYAPAALRQLAAERFPLTRRTAFTVTAESSLQAARRLHLAGSGHIAVLNFASARNPGGGYLGGARAQEEDLCRTSLLYPCLLEAPDYYEAHRASTDLLYSHRVIWSPAVPVHRGDRGELLTEPYPVSFLTCPAPNAGQVLRRDPDAGEGIARELSERAGLVLAVAAHHRVSELVLGAWGCGVFRNDPEQVADAFHAHLAADTGAYRDVFAKVVFAVWDRTPRSPRAGCTRQHRPVPRPLLRVPCRANAGPAAGRARRTAELQWDTEHMRRPCAHDPALTALPSGTPGLRRMTRSHETP
ncbi:TIGR02452 family protein [Streptomyces sp. NPDC020792]|uniref:TIGR02452 family protein n=1 Tax=Streptomyces sp. NPDC020792 TaxID=3365089 RepID=UPI0037A5BF40